MKSSSSLLYPIFALVIIFCISKYVMVKENKDRDKLEDAFDTVKNDPKTLDYLAFVADQPMWRLSLVGAMIGGMIYYIVYVLISQKAWSDKGVLGSVVLTTFIIYFISISMGNYMSSHNVCPRNCNDKYRYQDRCTKFSNLPCPKDS